MSWFRPSRRPVPERAQALLAAQYQVMATVVEQRKAALLEALGMDPTRDWDDIMNAVRCLNREAS